MAPRGRIGEVDQMSMYCESFLCYVLQERNKHPDVGGVPIGSRNSAPSRKGFVVNGHMRRQQRRMLALPPSRLTPETTVGLIVPRPCFLGDI